TGCNDSNACTTDACIGTGCSFTPNPQCQVCSGQPNGVSCGSCFVGGLCQNGSCAGGAPKSISSIEVIMNGRSDQFHVIPVRREVTFSASVTQSGCNSLQYLWDFGDG